MSGEPGDTVDWRARSARVIPGGSSTGSRRPRALYGSRAADGLVPTHFERAHGCVLVTPDGREFVDCGMALGAVGIGYADPRITAAVVAAAQAGNVTALPHRLEAEVAERVVALFPWAERAQFLRTGAEATAAAVRIARAATGRDRVIACGYFGWLDWCSDARGVPQATRDLITWVPFDDVPALEAAVQAGAPPAAIIVEPLVHDIASVTWLAAARRLASAAGAALILDEIKTAFRVRTGGVQALHGLAPDLLTVGKAFANGYPLAAVVGTRGLMEAAAETWISSTAAVESTGLAAALAVMDRHAQEDVCQQMAMAGSRLQEIIGGALGEASWAGVRVDGPPMMWRLVADADEQLDALVAAAAHHGVLLKRGAYQFGAVAHDEHALARVASAMPAIMDAVRPGVRRVR